MTDLKHQISSATTDSQDEIISFIQTLVQSPSLANDEADVQSIVLNKLETLGLKTEIVPVHFDELMDHPAFNDDGYGGAPMTSKVSSHFLAVLEDMIYFL